MPATLFGVNGTNVSSGASIAPTSLSIFHLPCKELPKNHDSDIMGQEHSIVNAF